MRDARETPATLTHFFLGLGLQLQERNVIVSRNGRDVVVLRDHAIAHIDIQTGDMKAWDLAPLPSERISSTWVSPGDLVFFPKEWFVDHSDADTGDIVVTLAGGVAHMNIKTGDMQVWPPDSARSERVSRISVSPENPVIFPEGWTILHLDVETGNMHAWTYAATDSSGWEISGAWVSPTAEHLAVSMIHLAVTRAVTAQKTLLLDLKTGVQTVGLDVSVNDFYWAPDGSRAVALVLNDPYCCFDPACDCWLGSFYLLDVNTGDWSKLEGSGDRLGSGSYSIDWVHSPPRVQERTRAVERDQPDYWVECVSVREDGHSYGYPMCTRLEFGRTKDEHRSLDLLPLLDEKAGEHHARKDGVFDLSAVWLPGLRHIWFSGWGTSVDDYYDWDWDGERFAWSYYGWVDPDTGAGDVQKLPLGLTYRAIGAQGSAAFFVKHYDPETGGPSSAAQDAGLYVLREDTMQEQRILADLADERPRWVEGVLVVQTLGETVVVDPATLECIPLGVQATEVRPLGGNRLLLTGPSTVTIVGTRGDNPVTLWQPRHEGEVLIGAPEFRGTRVLIMTTSQVFLIAEDGTERGPLVSRPADQNYDRSYVFSPDGCLLILRSAQFSPLQGRTYKWRTDVTFDIVLIPGG